MATWRGRWRCTRCCGDFSGPSCTTSLSTPQTWHEFGGMGFTWYGGVITGTAAVLIIIRRRGLPLGLVSGLLAVPLSLAYGIGRLGCLLAGDGTYGRPTDLPWGIAFPHGTVPTLVP